MHRLRTAVVFVLALVGSCCASVGIHHEITRPDVDTVVHKRGDLLVAEIDFHADVTDSSIDLALQGLDQVEKMGATQLLLDIDTNGGSVEAGNKLAARLEGDPIWVTCVVSEKALSMGFVLLQACDNRLVSRGAVVMIHEPFVVLSAFGLPVQRRWLVDQLAAHDRLADDLLPHALRKMRRPLPTIRKKIEFEDWQMTAEEAVQEGAADAIVPDLRSVRADLLADRLIYSWKISSFTVEP